MIKRVQDYDLGGGPFTGNISAICPGICVPDGLMLWETEWKRNPLKFHLRLEILFLSHRLQIQRAE